jgi:hypothetical protein
MIIWEPKELRSFKFPSEEKAPEPLAQADIRKIFSQELIKTGSLNFYKDILCTKQKCNDDAIEKIAKVVEERTDIDKGDGKIRCVAVASRAYLQYELFGEETKKIWLESIDDFCKVKLQSILDGIMDPVYVLSKAMAD